MLKPEKKTGEQGHSHSSKRVSCNGGGGALGHPLIWVNLRTGWERYLSILFQKI